MTYDDLIHHFDTAPTLAAALSRKTGRKIPPQTVYQWGKRGRVPLDQQILIEEITDGFLRADLSSEVRALLARPPRVVTHQPAQGFDVRRLLSGPSAQ